MPSKPQSARSGSDGSPGLLPGRVRLVALAVVALLVVVAGTVSISKASRQVDGGQFAHTVSGSIMYALSVGLRALFTPPLEYGTLAAGGALLAVAVFVPMLRLVDRLGGESEGEREG
jgi:hypothetical protein